MPQIRPARHPARGVSAGAMPQFLRSKTPEDERSGCGSGVSPAKERQDGLGREPVGKRQRAVAKQVVTVQERASGSHCWASVSE